MPLNNSNDYLQGLDLNNIDWEALNAQLAPLRDQQPQTMPQPQAQPMPQAQPQAMPQSMPQPQAMPQGNQNSFLPPGLNDYLNDLRGGRSWDDLTDSASKNVANQIEGWQGNTNNGWLTGGPGNQGAMPGLAPLNIQRGQNPFAGAAFNAGFKDFATPPPMPPTQPSAPPPSAPGAGYDRAAQMGPFSGAPKANLMRSQAAALRGGVNNG